jgi:hypothetical protein
VFLLTGITAKADIYEDPVSPGATVSHSACAVTGIKVSSYDFALLIPPPAFITFVDKGAHATENRIGTLTYWSACGEYALRVNAFAPAGSYEILTRYNFYGFSFGLPQSVTVTNVLTIATGLMPPAVLLQPSGRVIQEGETAVFTIAASGEPQVQHQWQRSTNGESTWESLPNDATYSDVKTTQLSVKKATLSMNGHRFRDVITNSAGSLTTIGATLTVTPKSPVLAIKRITGGITISWPAAFTSFYPQARPTLIQPDWAAVGNPPALVAGEFLLTNTTSGSSGFYRLKSQ